MVSTRTIGLLALAFWLPAAMGPQALAQRLPSAEPPLLGYPRLVVPGPVLRFETTEGVFRIALFSQAAPRMTRVFQERAEDGVFRREGFWRRRADGVQLGSPMMDVSDGGALDVRSWSPGSSPTRDPHALPFLATDGAFGFERTGLPAIEGSVLMDQRFIVQGQLLRREYFVALKPGFPRGVVVGHVISGLEVVKRLDGRDGILDVRVEAP